MPINKPVIDRVHERYEVDSEGCWVWLSTKNKDGYGVITADKTRWLAHRLSYVLYVGQIPDGNTLDHLCRNRACINPDHLEPVTQKENLYRGNHPNMVRMRENKCIRGHAVVGNNVSLREDGRKKCRKCINAKARAYRARKKRQKGANAAIARAGK